MNAWAITADHAADRIQAEFRGFIPSLVGMVSPEEITLTADEIARHPLAKMFRVFDEAGVVYEGFLLNEVGVLTPTLPGHAEPWRSICSGRAYTVEVFLDGSWQRSQYLGMGDDQ